VNDAALDCSGRVVGRDVKYLSCCCADEISSISLMVI
jgi:hypothetical protein